MICGDGTAHETLRFEWSNAGVKEDEQDSDETNTDDTTENTTKDGGDVHLF
jgi:hypothetical protein